MRLLILILTVALIGETVCDCSGPFYPKRIRALREDLDRVISQDKRLQRHLTSSALSDYLKNKISARCSRMAKKLKDAASGDLCRGSENLLLNDVEAGVQKALANQRPYMKLIKK